jgi:CHAT domain-containing protein/tetratricopeptide (TPR) repeat protein
MNDLISFDLTAHLSALAVFGSADSTTLSILLDREPPSPELAALRDHPAITVKNNSLYLNKETAKEALKKLEQEDLPLFRDLHQRAFVLLVKRLRSGEATMEPAFLAVFERWMNRLLVDDPERFMELVDSVRDLPLTTARGRQLRSYYQGLALRKQERFEEAISAFETLLAEPDLDLHVQGRTLNSRANCHRIIGRSEAALNGYRESVKIWRQLGDKLNEGKVLLNMGITMYDLQNYTVAEENLSQAAVFFEETGSSGWLAGTYNELGLVCRDQGKWEEALDHFENCLAVYRAAESQDLEGRALNNFGEVLLFQGYLERAQAAFQAALEKMTTQVYRVDTHLNLGLIHQAAGKLDQALEDFQKARDLTIEIGRGDILPHTHYRLGDLLQRMGDDIGALEEFQASAEVIEQIRSPMQEEELKISLLGRWQQVYETLVLHYLAQSRSVEAFQWAERARARAFADALMSSFSSNNRGESAVLPPVVTVEDIQAHLLDEEAVCCYFTTGILERDIPLLKALPKDNPLRQHLLTQARTLLFFITKSNLTYYDCNIDPNKFITDSPRRIDYELFLGEAVRQRLYEALFGVANEILSYRHLYIIPHGPLHHVPFCALIDQATEPALRTSQPVLTYSPSATILLRHSLQSTEPRAAFLAGLTVGYRGATRVSLSFTELEANMVANLMNGQAWVGPQHKKETLRVASADQSWLHFACHGWYNHEQPLESYLETGKDERLTAREVMQDWHLKAELITLSACQTGVSRVLRGDEPMGLIRAFLYAGARSMLVSQWVMEDFPTFLLMYRFYQELRRGTATNLSEALHKVQGWLQSITIAQIQETIAKLPPASSGRMKLPERLTNLPADSQPFAHPRYWAGFIIVGETKRS